MDDLEKLRKLTKTITSNGYLTDQTKAWQYAFDSVKELVCITNPSFKIKFINKPLIKKLKLKDNFLNEKLENILDKELFTLDRSVGSYDERLMMQKVTYYGEAYIKELDGWYERYRYYIENSSGKLIGYTFMLIDVTLRKKTQLILEDNKKLLEGVLDAIPDIISVQDRDSNVIKCNEAAKNYFKLTSKEIEGEYKKCYQLLGRTEPCLECQTRICKQTKKMARMERFIPELNAWFDCRSYPILDDDGNVTKVIEHLRDITDFKREQCLCDACFNDICEKNKKS